jgi:hypothetical protein
MRFCSVALEIAVRIKICGFSHAFAGHQECVSYFFAPGRLLLSTSRNNELDTPHSAKARRAPNRSSPTRGVRIPPGSLADCILPCSASHVQNFKTIPPRRIRLFDGILPLAFGCREPFRILLRHDSVDVQCVDRRTELIPPVARGMNMAWKCLPVRVPMFTGLLFLWCGIARSQNAEALVRTNYLFDDRLRARGGVRSLSSRETMYSLAFSSNPSNWLGTVWIMVDYLVWKSLARYGFAREAGILALRGNDLSKAGSLNEYYHPDTEEARVTRASWIGIFSPWR